MSSKELIKYLKNSIDGKGNYCYSLPIETTKTVIEYIKEQNDEIDRLHSIINELDKQNGELGADLSIIEDRVNKTNWWLENMLKQATNIETKAIISGTLELLLGSDKE